MAAVTNGHSDDDELLLRVDYVRCKSDPSGEPGCLQLNKNYIMWTPNPSSKHKVIKISYRLIKGQRVSPDNKPKVQLQLLMMDEKLSYTFHFVHPLGFDTQLQERNTLKELMQQILPQHRQIQPAHNHVIPAGNKDLEKKQRILQENKELRQLYMGLVDGHVISAEEFWKNYAHDALHPKCNTSEQKAGISAGFLSNVAAMDGCNGLKLTITNDVINAIFTAYPAVKQKHLDKVPHEMTEQEFWTKFFQSHYFHRDRVKNLSPQEMFADCLQLEEKDMDTVTEKGTTSKMYDLNLTQDADALTGLVSSFDPSSKKSSNSALLRRFNYHSSRVLESCLGSEQPSTSRGTIGSTLPQTSNDPHIHPFKKARFDPGSSLSDRECPELEAISTYMFNDQSQSALSIKSRDNNVDDKTNQKLAKKYVNSLKLAMKNEGFIDERLEEDTMALATVSRLVSNHHIPANPNIPKVVLDEIKSTFLSAQEVLRHFWCCFPVKNNELATKLQKMEETLLKFKSSKLVQAKETLIKHGVDVTTVEHIQTMVDAAINKFNVWNSKRPK